MAASAMMVQQGKDFEMTQGGDKTLMAAGLILTYAVIIGFTDNFVRVIAAESGLWQFHLLRGCIALGLIGLAALPMGLRVRPVHWRAVVARSSLIGIAMIIYFGALAFLPVALVAAGLFTAPIFVLLISSLVFGEVIGPYRIGAVIVGFIGVVLVLGPQAMAGASLPALLPVLAGAIYAMGNITTRRWCYAESAATLLAGFFIALMIIGAIGLIVLAIFPMTAPAGVEGFLQRGAVWPSATVWFWTFVQAAGSLVAVGMMVRAYLIADVTRVAVFEYAILPASAFWSWALWGETLDWLAVFGMVLISAAGLMIAWRAQHAG